ncbi:hypothetical protein [Moraxella sp. CTOTU49803]|uniref:hypothetical protein n=1 Tax=Moraxella sp. CTOTU49803 TaxID=2953840 RepID=UPI0028A5C0D9|nr:hypothetical protein [Moraxella sp. CTOTU49803]
MTITHIIQQTEQARTIISDTLTQLSMILDESSKFAHLANSMSHEIMQAWHHLSNAILLGGHHEND